MVWRHAPGWLLLGSPYLPCRGETEPIALTRVVEQTQGEEESQHGVHP